MIVNAAAISRSAPNETKTIVPINSNGPHPPEVDGIIPLKLAKTPKNKIARKVLFKFKFN